MNNSRRVQRHSIVRIARAGSIAGAPGVAVATVLASAVVSSASAATASESYTDSSSVYTRTVSNTEPSVGQKITYTQTFTTKRSTDSIYNWQNKVDACLKYVPGSATLQIGDGGAIPLPNSAVSTEPGVTTITSTEAKGYWEFSATNPHTFTLDYEVSEECSTEKPLQSGFAYTYRGWLGKSSKDYAPSKFNGGPAVKVQEAAKAQTSLELSALPEVVEKAAPLKLEAKLAITQPPANGEAATVAGRNVEFVSNGQVLCTAEANEDGVATCDWTPEATGEASIVARFAPVDNLLGATSAPVKTRVVTALPKAPTEVRVEPTPLRSTDVARVSGKAAAGQFVEVTGPADTRCVATADAEGSFVCELGYLPVGKGHQITVNASQEGVKSPAAIVTVDVEGKTLTVWERIVEFFKSLGARLAALFGGGSNGSTGSLSSSS